MKKLFLKKKKWLWVSGMLIFFLEIPALAGWYWWGKMTQYHHVEINKSDKALGISSDIKPSSSLKEKEKESSSKREEERQMIKESEDKIIHIALFGVDRRSMKERGRSDAIMIGTIDFIHRKVKLTSLMRDLYVPIENHGYTKLNHAYAYGGPELAIKTINQNFGTNIRDYVTVDFFTLEKIIDAIGGVQIEVKPNEIPLINRHMKEVAAIKGEKAILLKRSGIQRLNGMQAVAYARVRYVGNGDFERTERQRKVIMAMIEEIQRQGVASIPSLIAKISPYVETSLDSSTILNLAYEYFKHQPMSLEQQRFPMDGKWKGVRIDGRWYIKTNLKEMREMIMDYLYRDISPASSKTEKKIQ